MATAVLLLEEPPPIAMAVEKRRRVFVSPQVGHGCASPTWDMRNFFSKGYPQLWQVNSYMGMIQFSNYYFMGVYSVRVDYGRFFTDSLHKTLKHSGSLMNCRVGAWPCARPVAGDHNRSESQHSLYCKVCSVG